VDDELVAVLLALVAAAAWGLSAVLVRKGLSDLSTASGTLISLAAGFVFTALLVLILEREAAAGVSLEAIVLFAVVGILNFPLGRFFNYMAVERLGIGLATPILASSPVFAMVLAVLVSGEQVNAATLAGTALILAGLFVTLRRRAPAPST
jgi:drug/metabolite transporter (DMT)-like permease